jgi:hypothetical protein
MWASLTLVRVRDEWARATILSRVEAQTSNSGRLRAWICEKREYVGATVVRTLPHPAATRRGTQLKGEARRLRQPIKPIFRPLTPWHEGVSQADFGALLKAHPGHGSETLIIVSRNGGCTVAKVGLCCSFPVTSQAIL